MTSDKWKDVSHNAGLATAGSVIGGYIGGGGQFNEFTMGMAVFCAICAITAFLIQGWSMYQEGKNDR